MYIKQLICFITIFTFCYFRTRANRISMKLKLFQQSLLQLCIWFILQSISVTLQSRTLFESCLSHIRACQFSLIFSKENWSHSTAEKMKEHLQICFSSSFSRNMFMPAVRFSRSRISRSSDGGSIYDWQQIRGVKRITLKGRKERSTIPR